MLRSKMRREILITPQERDYLMRVFECSDVTVYNAVKYRKNNELHKKIRRAAIERGNARVVVVPEFETIFLTNRVDADERVTRYMIQAFENGATLEVNLSSGETTVRNSHGVVAYTYQNPRANELKAIQEVAKAL